ncbi:MAG: S46 family peptidase, partial [Steroidobacteraceae bacterium]
MRRVIAALGFCASLASTSGQADEGMWTYDNFPSAKVRETYGVDIDQAWLDQVRQSTVRLSGCTASFVSPDGLILTNHHCVSSCLAENSSKESSLLEDGFLAAGREQELRCSTQVADVLVSMEDITSQVAAATQGLDDVAANDARKRTLTALEKACEESSGLKCQAVTLYDGGQYFLYGYKRYTDVRLAFAPEAGIAAFGGDPDNFQFPRWCLDMSLLRAYEDGAPAKVDHHLKVNFEGPQAGEFVLVSGHPGSTDRLLTVSQLESLRSVDLPPSLLRGSELRGRYIQFAKDSETNHRIRADPLRGLENGLKVRRKLLDALLDENLMQEKREREASLRRDAAALPSLEGLGDPWQDIAEANQRYADMANEYGFLEGGAGFSSRGQDLHCVFRIFLVAVVEVLGVENRLQAVLLEDRACGLGQFDAEGVRDVDHGHSLADLALVDHLLQHVRHRVGEGGGRAQCEEDRGVALGQLGRLVGDGADGDLRIAVLGEYRCRP